MPRDKKNIPAIPFEFKEAVTRLLQTKPPKRKAPAKKSRTKAR